MKCDIETREAGMSVEERAQTQAIRDRIAARRAAAEAAMSPIERAEKRVQDALYARAEADGNWTGNDDATRDAMRAAAQELRDAKAALEALK
jgi:hypothetical protein